jgi:hypothetical protein
MSWFLSQLLACGSYGLQETIVVAEGTVEVATEPSAMLTFDTVPFDGRAMAGAEFAIVNVGEDSVTVNAIEVSTTHPETGADVFRTEAEQVDEPLPIPRTLKTGERFPLQLLFQPDAVDAYQGRVLVRFAGDALVERALFGEGCDPDASGCVAPAD